MTVIPHLSLSEAQDALGGGVAVSDVFLDGNRVTPGTEKCQCGPDCEFPCWQRLGLTTDPCCKNCPPLPEEDE